MKWYKKVIELQNRIVGMNERNYRFIYKNNARKDYNLADDKATCKSILEANNIPTPKTYWIIEHMGEVSSKLEGLNTLNAVAIKPARGSGGGGILILKKVNNEWTSPSGRKYSRRDLEIHIANILFGLYSKKDSDKAIFEYCLDPHQFFLNIYPKGVPDFRIIILKDKPVLAMLRLPTNSSDGKANLHAGAIGVGIDLSTGVLQYGYDSKRKKSVKSHPDTDTVFYGEKIPNWERTFEIALQTAKLFPLNYLGIDIVFDNQYGPMVIEINARPGMQIQNINNLGIKEILNSNKS
jgi:alpha-L-glutamate ligase-like protein